MLIWNSNGKKIEECFLREKIKRFFFVDRKSRHADTENYFRFYRTNKKLNSLKFFLSQVEMVENILYLRDDHGSLFSSSELR